jgi:hypothetical protein
MNAVKENIRKVFGYDCVKEFKEDRAVAAKDGRYFHVLPDYKPLYPETYDKAYDFVNKFAVVKNNGLSTHLNFDGKLAHGQWLEWALDFHPNEQGELLAQVRKNREGFSMRTDGTRFNSEVPTAQ